MMGVFVRQVILVLVLLSGGTLSVPSIAATSAPQTSDELSAVISQLCSRKVVLLGEDANHAGTQTIALKADIARRLITSCGFRGVVFESQFYDFVDVQRALDQGTSSLPQFSSAIGALWSHYAEFKPFEAWLYAQALAKHVLVAGIDPQVGGIDARFSQEKLPSVISSVLGGDDRVRCHEAIARHNAWAYDDAHPFDDAAFATLDQCLRTSAVSTTAHSGVEAGRTAAMIASYQAYLRSIAPHAANGGLRDKAMYENLLWVLSQWPKDTKVLIWTATVHAAKAPMEGNTPGQQTLGTYIRKAWGGDAYALGFSALGGAYGSTGGHGQVHPLVAPPPDSLEALAFSKAPDREAARFLDEKVLKRLGNVPGRAFNYGTFQTVDWSRYVDGIVVLRTETAHAAVD
ncbi:erythromycin esterase family protein [Luteibacter pinisoli]|nr:erythromycin esterase family protein [Luteibacter pinisoli]